MVNCSDQRKAKMYHCTDRLNKPVLHFSPICCPFYRHSLADVTSPLQVFLAKCCGHWLSLSRNAMVDGMIQVPLLIYSEHRNADRQTDRQRDREQTDRQHTRSVQEYDIVHSNDGFLLLRLRTTLSTCPHHQQHMPHTTSMLTSSSPVRSPATHATHNQHAHLIIACQTT